MAELADAHGSGPCGLTAVEVRIFSRAPDRRLSLRRQPFLFFLLFFFYFRTLILSLIRSFCVTYSHPLRRLLASSALLICFFCVTDLHLLRHLFVSSAFFISFRYLLFHFLKIVFFRIPAFTRLSDQPGAPQSHRIQATDHSSCLPARRFFF